jgi:hypothetical protein
MRALIAVLLILLPLFGEAGPLRVAILSSARVSEMGIEDLLLATLSEEPDLLLVERGLLTAVTNEQAMENLYSTRSNRNDLGRVVAADFLVMLQASDESLRLTITDTKLGATLTNETLPAGGHSTQQLIRLLAQEVRSTIGRFKGGIKAIAAVPDLVSRDLLLDLSFLQNNYAEVLRSACRGLPGVAVVAIEEARALAQERDLSGAEQTERPLVVFVEGEYRTQHNGDAERTVRIQLRAQGGEKPLLDETSGPLPISSAGVFLWKTFSERLAPHLSDQPKAGINAAREFELLKARAEMFFSIGDFRRSAALREAALLINPGADEQRIQLIQDYGGTNAQPVERSQWPRGARESNSDPFWRYVVERTKADWRRALQHCEYLIRNRRVCREKATNLTHNTLHSIYGVRGTSWELLGDCEAVKKDFVREVFSRVPLLDAATPAERASLTGALDWEHFLFESALFRCDGNFYDRSDLDLLVDLLATRLPGGAKPSPPLISFLQRAVDGPDADCRFSESELVAFLTKLITSNRPLAQLYGRSGMLRYRCHKKGESNERLLIEARAISEEAKKIWSNIQDDDPLMSLVRGHVFQLTAALNAKEDARTEVTQPPALSAQPAHDTASPRARERIAPSRAGVTAEPVEIQLTSRVHQEKSLTPEVRWRARGGWHPVNGFASLGDGLDVFWTQGALLFMTTPGRADEVLADENLTLWDVISDGTYVWASAVGEPGLYVFDHWGQQVARIGAKQGLPPAEHSSPILHPLAPGKILVSGCFGNSYRAWIALVEIEGNQSRVNVFHEATRIGHSGGIHPARSIPPSNRSALPSIHRPMVCDVST